MIRETLKHELQTLIRHRTTKRNICVSNLFLYRCLTSVQLSIARQDVEQHQKTESDIIIL